ncbi:MAG: hypothetical protein RJA70_4468 [Pseudomonadota bacterium]|jgi:hypothetical protein
MSYTLSDSGKVVGGKGFESFFLFIRFGLSEQEGQLQIQSTGNYFAFYGSYNSDSRDCDLPDFSEGQSKNYELTGENDMTLALNSLSLQESRCTDMSNESSHLHLFQFLATPDQGPETWVNDGGWNASYENRSANHRPQEIFVPHLVSFGDCSDRDCYWTMARDTSLGTNRLGLAQPFLKDSILVNLLKNHRSECPKLELSINEQKWSVFDSTPLPGNPTGYAMICSGVFKEMALSTELERWHKLTSGAPAPQDIMDELSMVAERRGRTASGSNLFVRTARTADQTDDNAVVQEDKRHPTEVLFLDLALKHRIERLIQYK